MFKFELPDLGEGIHEAEVLQVKVKEGDVVREDQAIFEVETDKAVVEIPSPVAGKVEKVHVQSGQTVTVGTVMITFSQGAEAPAKGAAKAQEAKPATKQADEAAAPPQKTPALATAVEAKSGASGNGRGAVVQPGAERVVPATPATRRLARELGVDLSLVRATGPAGRVLSEDVRSFAAGSLEGAITGTAKAPNSIKIHPEVAESLAAKYGDSQAGAGGALSSPMSGAGAPFELPDFTKYGQVERVPLKSIRRKIAQNMTQSWTHIPHVTHFDEADVGSLETVRARHEEEVKARGGRLTMTVFTIKAVVSGLKKYPQFNASLDERTGELVFKKYYNIGIAVATDRGLIVPVIKNADQKSFTEIAIELADLAEKTRSGKVELDRLQGGTFTITNIGAIGGTSMVPMVNFPECAILGMARATKKPVVRDDKIDIGLIMPLALSFDHRIADGAEAAYFVGHIIKLLQDPFSFLLEA